MTPARLRASHRTIAAVLTAAIVVAVGARTTVGMGGDAFTGTQPQTGAFMLGVLRADGILLPFASYDGDDWKTNWPADLAARDLPAMLDAVPRGWWGGAPAAPWSLWSPDANTPATFNVVSPIVLMVGRARRLGLRTDQKPSPVPVPPYAVPFPKAGLAVTGNVTVHPIPPVSLLAPAWRDLLAVIGPALTEAEERTVSGLRNNVSWTHPFDKAARARIQPELEAWYTSSIEGSDSHVSYIEAVKKYPPGPSDDGCGLETVMTGWIHQAKADKKPRTTFKAVVTYCDRERTSYMLPLGRIVVRSRTHWVFQMSGADHEWYAVAEVTPRRVRYVAEYHGGGFAR